MHRVESVSATIINVSDRLPVWCFWSSRISFVVLKSTKVKTVEKTKKGIKLALASLTLSETRSASFIEWLDFPFKGLRYLHI